MVAEITESILVKVDTAKTAAQLSITVGPVSGCFLVARFG
jgi:hypothetical protein